MDGDRLRSARTELLERLVAITQEMLQTQDVVRPLESIGVSVLALFGFRYGSIVVSDEAGELRRRVLLGFDEETRRQRVGERISREYVERLLLPEFEILPSCFYIPAERNIQNARAVQTPDGGRDRPRTSPTAWHPRDSLTLILLDRNERMQAYVNVDGPIDGKVPGTETLREMQLFVNLVGLALANAGMLREQQQRIAAQALALEASQNLLLEIKHATTDPLTGIANRRVFDDMLESEWKRARRASSSLALALFDVDHFKLYNDRYGHVAGDECLKSVAAIIAGSVKRPNDVAARYGGEEFATIFPSVDRAGGYAIAEDIRQRVLGLRIVHAESEHGFVTVSAGVAAARAAETEPRDLVRTADANLYVAKSDGRNRVAC